MFHRSIADNIRVGRPAANDDEVRRAARAAHALEFIEQMPQGFDTVVGERGVKISGGQRQRIAIARAMLKDPSILILDEATSSLDSESEALIQEALWTLLETRTAIVIAHRLSTVRRMDELMILEPGASSNAARTTSAVEQRRLRVVWAHQREGSCRRSKLRNWWRKRMPQSPPPPPPPPPPPLDVNQASHKLRSPT